jgi:heptosyltransferase I
MSFPLERPPDSVCVIRLSAIGDCCHTLPVIRSIQAAWPRTAITWIIGKTEYGLMKGVEGVEFITFDKSRALTQLAGVRQSLIGRRYPVLLQMHASMRANLVSRMVRADIRLGFDRARARDYQWLFTNARIPARRQEHVMDGLFGFIEHLGIGERVMRWDIPLSAADQQFADRVTEDDTPVCVISPCSSQRFRNYRNWSTENYAALADHIHAEHNARVILTGGPTELELDYGAKIQAAVRHRISNLIGRTDLKQLLAVLQRAALLICPDSGPAHMATAVGTPVIGLYATSNRHRTGPYFSQELVVDKYPEAVKQEFSRPISELRWGERVRNPNAMSLIRLEAVLEKVELILGSGDGRIHKNPPG